MNTPVLLFDNEQERSSLTAIYNSAKDDAQSVLNLYNGLGLTALTSAEFPRLFNDTPALIFDKLTGGNGLSISGIQVDKNKAIDIIVKPDGYAPLLAAIEAYKGRAMAGYEGVNARQNIVVSRITDYFKLSAGAVALSDVLVTQLANTGKYYTSTDKGIAHAAFAQAVVAAFFTTGVCHHYGTPSPNDCASRLKQIIGDTVEAICLQSQTYRPKFRNWPER